MRVGLLTGGGDCPGLNAVIRAVVRKGERHYGDELVGFRDGWKGVLEDSTMVLDVERCRGILPRGGTILGTSRTNPYKIEDGVKKVLDTLRKERIDALIAIGGEDTLGVANKLGAEGIGVVGVPKTIDNDLSCTEVTFGFDTALQIATDAIDRLHTTAESHDRVIVLEVMGRHAGWIATEAGIAGGAAEILIPEEQFDLERVGGDLKHRHEKGRFASIVVVAEGATPQAVRRRGGCPVLRPRRPMQRLPSARAAALQAAAAGALLARGLRPGDRVAFSCPNSAELLCTLLGAMRAGIVPMPVNPALLEEERAAILDDAGPALVVGPDELAALLQGPKADLAPVPLVRPMHYTSGPTGRPKGGWS